MSVQARFYIDTATAHSWGSAEPGKRTGSVVLKAVCRGPENKTWSAATPSGEMTMTMTNPAAFEWFLSHLASEVAITIEERPAICEVCHEEVTKGATGGESGQGGYSEIPFTHARCASRT